MSTNYFTPIGMSASNHPDTINNPLGQLDAAITAAQRVLQDAIDALILEAGTSDAETIAARTTIKYKAGTPPATLGVALAYAGQSVHNVAAYGASTANTAAQNTTAINAAIAAAIGGTVIFPAGGGSYDVNECTIANSCRIIGNGCELMGNVSANFAVFAVTADIDWLHIEGFNFDWDTAKGVSTETRYDAFTNGDERGELGGTNYSTVWFEIDQLLIERCNFRGSRVWIWSDGVTTHPIVRDCTWGTGAVAPDDELWFNTALLMAGADVQMLNNRFDVYTTNGLNRDIAKLAETGTKHAKVIGNYFKNYNPASQSQLDIYNGGNRATVENNTFINCQLVRKIVGAGPVVIELKHDKIINNHFEIEDSGTYPAIFIDYNGCMGIISGNTFEGDGVAGKCCIDWIMKENYGEYELDANGTPISTPYPLAMIITGNMSHNVDLFIASHMDEANDFDSGKAIISNNLIWNADYILRIFDTDFKPGQLVVTGNYWMPTENPNFQVAMMAGTGNVILGNAVDPTLGAFVPPVSFGATTVYSIRSGSLTVNDDAVGFITPIADRGIIKVWTGSASTEAAIFSYRVTSSGHFCAVMAQESNIFNAAIKTGVPVYTDYVDTKMTIVASNNGNIYFVNQRGGLRGFNYTIEAA